jgi:acyl-CoA thioester hydrolase
MAAGRTVTRKLRIDPRFHETDMMGIIHNAVYFTWFEQGRLQIMADIMSFDEALQRNVVVPVVRNHCTYKNPVRFGDPLILTTTHEIRDPYVGKLVFAHSLMHEKRKTEMACGETVVTILDRSNSQLVKQWPEDVWQRYLALT